MRLLVLNGDFAGVYDKPASRRQAKQIRRPSSRLGLLIPPYSSWVISSAERRRAPTEVLGAAQQALPGERLAATLVLPFWDRQSG
jgi:hypothetical protein